MTADLPALSDADVIELERLCDLAHHAVEAARGTASANDDPNPEVGAALEAITVRLVQAGVGRPVAEQTTIRWYLTRQAGGARVPIVECLAVEADPPYPTGRRRPGTSGPGRK